jgi:hypothetical protein
VVKLVIKNLKDPRVFKDWPVLPQVRLLAKCKERKWGKKGG